jgi:hypothetical protein
MFACHLPVGSDASREAFEKNLAAGLPQTLAVAEGAVVDESIVDLAAGSN